MPEGMGYPSKKKSPTTTKDSKGGKMKYPSGKKMSYPSGKKTPMAKKKMGAY